MTSIRRVAPLSLTLSVLLLAGSASAAPVQREGVLKSFGKAVAAGVRVGTAEFKQRREQAGPGLIKRTMVKAKEFIAADWKQTKADFKAATIATTGAVQGAVERADNARVSVGVATAMTAAATKNKVVTAHKGFVVSIKSAVAAFAERRAQAKALRAANKDIESFFNEKGNEDLRTYLVGVKKEARLTSTRVIRNLNGVAAAANAAVGIVSPANLLMAGASAAVAKSMSGGIRDAQRAAYTKALIDAVNRPGARVDSARLEGWVKAGAVNDFTK